MTMHGKKTTSPKLRQEEKQLFGLITKEQRALQKTSCSNEFINILLNRICCEFLLLNVVVAHYGVEDIIK